MNIFKDNHEYSFRIFRNGLNILMNIETSRNDDWIFKRIFKKLNEYSFKYSFKYSTPFKMSWIFI